MQLCGNFSVELQNTAQVRGSLYRQAFPLTLSYFCKVKEINLILAVDLVGKDEYVIVLMTIIHFSPTHQPSGYKKLAMASFCEHLRPMEKGPAKNQFWKDDLVDFGSLNGQCLSVQLKLIGTSEPYKLLRF